jgi:hypothetical protein
MSTQEARLQKATAEIAGNESLLEMLDAEAAAEMLNWAKTVVATLVQTTDGMDDVAAETYLEARLKAVRQTMRSVGNWAAGNYSDPDSRAQLRDKLQENLKTIYGEGKNIPPADRIESFLNRPSFMSQTQLQSVQDFKSMLEQAQ